MQLVDVLTTIHS